MKGKVDKNNPKVIHFVDNSGLWIPITGLVVSTIGALFALGLLAGWW
ncbi:hypothetical protein [Periweissella cryptocerci]|nr:hypothetical protein [Periweissella cryptocerci]